MFLFLFDGDADAVYLHTAVGGDKNIFAPVDDPGLHQITEFGVKTYLHLRGADLKTLAVDEIGRAESLAALKLLPAPAAEKLRLLGAGTAVLQNVPNSSGETMSGSGSRLSLWRLIRSLSCSWTP